MKKLIFPVAVIAAMLAVSSCTTTKTLYSWYDYEDATYQYHKRSTEELQVKVLEQYKKITDKQKGVRGVVPERSVPNVFKSVCSFLVESVFGDSIAVFVGNSVPSFPIVKHITVGAFANKSHTSRKSPRTVGNKKISAIDLQRILTYELSEKAFLLFNVYDFVSLIILAVESEMETSFHV